MVAIWMKPAIIAADWFIAEDPLPLLWWGLNISANPGDETFPYPGRFFLLGITVICRPWKRVSLRSLERINPSTVSNSIYANLTFWCKKLIGLPFWLPTRFIHRNSDANNVPTLFKVLFKVRHIRLEMYILHKNRAFIRVISGHSWFRFTRRVFFSRESWISWSLWNH